jgi:hypothetical protein
MRALLRGSNRLVPALTVAVMLELTIGITGCGGGGTGWSSVYPWLGSTSTGDTSATTGPGSTGTVTGGQQGASDRTAGDPCTETLSRKFVTVSMRNYGRDYIHYFFVAIAFVNVDQTDTNAVIPTFDGTQFPDGAVCPDDIGLYTQHGYSVIQSGAFKEFGDYCITGPALYYFHDNGNFRVAAGTSDAGLGSAIAPAQGQLPSYDNFFTSAGAQIPVPDLILFHNPGAGGGAALKVSTPTITPCSVLVTMGDPPCNRDSFYYVSFNDVMVGSRALGPGSGRRVPSDIQGTGCECQGVSEAYQILAPSGVRASGAECNEFFRGGRIDFAFFEDDTTPSFPQLVWRVTDGSGTVAHEYSALSPLAGAH